jgi:hypothetical protein
MDDDTTRHCRQCGDPKPLGEFRLKRKNGSRRETDCNRCHSQNMKAWRRARSQKTLRRFVKSAPNQNLDRRLRGLAAAALKRFGGVQALASLMASETRAIHALRPGDPLPLQAVMTVLRLHEFCESRQVADEEAENDMYSGMTADELRADLNARMQRVLQAMIQEHPDIAVEAAETLGWTVIPPHESTIA